MDKNFWLKLLKSPDIILYYDQEEKHIFTGTVEGLEKTMSDKFIMEVDEKKLEIRIWRLKK